MTTAVQDPSVQDSNAGGLEIEATDVTGHHTFRVRDYPERSTVDDLVRTLVAGMELSHTDPTGTPYTYHARLDREGRHLHASEIVGDALQTGDRISLQPNIDAG
jgi:hypothetical protein